MTLHDTLMIKTWHCAFVKTYGTVLHKEYILSIQKFINHLEGQRIQDGMQNVTKDSKCVTNV